MQSKFIIGIDLGATNVKIGLLDSKGKILKKVNLTTKSFPGRLKLLAEITRTVHNILQEKKLHAKDIIGAGIGLPGPVDFKNGIVDYLPNIPGWRKFPIRKWFSLRTGIKTFVDNDVNLIALAESRMGAARNAKNAVCITLGTGVGGGVIIDGNIYRGSSFSAGEVGHMPIAEKGRKCNCGGRGCLERFVGNKYLLQKARGSFGSSISLERLAELAKKKNKKAIAIWQEAGRHIGVALAGVVNLLNPDRIVIGGGVANAGKVLFDEIENTVKSLAMPTQRRTVKIVKAKLTDNAGIFGAMFLVKENTD
ncbi:MAG: ROK family protein [Candidatus Omnitrophica bacterium]|nr:ROK family protein [Candidatus Omnitrophota bacterium]